jgi:hypothetical protein
MKKILFLFVFILLAAAAFSQKKGESLIKGDYEIYDAIGYKRVILFTKEVNGKTMCGFASGYLEVLVEPIYEDATCRSYEGMWCVKKNGKWGAYDETIRTQTVECLYDWIGYWKKENGIIKVQVELNGRRFWIDNKGNRL